MSHPVNSQRKKGKGNKMNKEILELVNEVQMTLPPLTQAATVLNLLIENYNLDKLNPSGDEMLDIGIHHTEIFNILQLVKTTLYNTTEEIERITENARKEEGAA